MKSLYNKLQLITLIKAKDNDKELHNYIKGSMRYIMLECCKLAWDTSVLYLIESYLLHAKECFIYYQIINVMSYNKFFNHTIILSLIILCEWSVEYILPLLVFISRVRHE